MDENKEDLKGKTTGENSSTNEEQKKKEEIRKDYERLEVAMDAGKFIFLIAGKEIDGSTQTSLIINRNYQNSPSMKLLVQIAAIEAVSMLSRELVKEFSEKNLTIGPLKNFFSLEKLSDFIGDRLIKLVEEGKITINDPEVQKKFFNLEEEK